MKKREKLVFNTLSGERSEKADRLHRRLRSLGVNFATGVPCGVIRHVIGNFEEDEEVTHIIANRESEAVGIAAGAYFGGSVPVVYMQNSGFFSASNDIASLLIPYSIPMLFIVSYRGCEGEDAVQHLTTGSTTQSLIHSFGLPLVVYSDQEIDKLIISTFDEMMQASLPTVLLVKRGWQR